MTENTKRIEIINHDGMVFIIDQGVTDAMIRGTLDIWLNGTGVIVVPYVSDGRRGARYIHPRDVAYVLVTQPNEK